MADESNAPEWRAVQDFPDYEVSSHGQVRRARGRLPRSVLKGEVSNVGYVRVCLYRDKKVQRHSVHRLVACAFHGDPPTPSHQAAHNDGNRLNNRASNVRWVTAKENAGDRDVHGRTARGVKNSEAKLTDAKVREIRELLDCGVGMRKLASEYGVAKYSIFKIKHNLGWKHVT
jgi:hypothetical protein